MEIKKVAVIGCGTMGGGIAQVCAQAGYQVMAYEPEQALLDKGLAAIAAFLDKGVQKGKLSPEGREQTLGAIGTTTDLGQLSGCDLVIEAVPEKLSLKQEILGRLDKICPGHAILASNTSTLSIIDLAQATSRPGRVLGVHFFNPVPLMRLVELVRSLATEQEVVELAQKFGESLGKTVIVAKDTPGFIVNYLQLPFRLNAIRMVEMGLASPQDIDNAATLGLGHPMGPLTLQDVVGLDVTLAGATAIYQATGDPSYKPPVLMQKMVAAGWLGKKAGKGFYEYD